MTRLTIGMPVYNGAATIEAALDSLLAQSFQDFEIVISDNGSTDATEAVCRDYTTRDPRIRYIRQPANLGPMMNFRFVLSRADSEFFMWAAADDQWAPAFAQANLAALEQNPGAVVSQSKVLFASGGMASHLSTGTFPLPYDTRRNTALFCGIASDASRFYGVFRTAALRQAFPAIRFYAFDWAVCAATLRFGTHHEVPDVLMLRDFTDASHYGQKMIMADHTSRLARTFPLLVMTRWLLLGRRVPVSPSILFSLAKLNLYIHFRFGLYRWEWLAVRYLRASGIGATIREVARDAVLAPVPPRLRPPLLRGSARVVRWVSRRTSGAADAARRMDTVQVRDQGETIGPQTTEARRLAAPLTHGWTRPARLHGRAPAASVIVVVRNDLLATLTLIEALVAPDTTVLGDAPPLEIIVSDNGSTDATVFLTQIRPEIVVVRLPVPVSYADAASAGVTRAAADTLIFLDQTPPPPPGFVRGLLAGLEHADLALLNARRPRTYPLFAGAGLEGSRLASSQDADRRPSGFALRRATLAADAGFPAWRETFEPAALDLSARMTKEGKRVAVLAED